LDRAAYPARVVAELQVVEPGDVVDAVGQLHEQYEVLRPQVQRAVRPAEVEALVLGQLATGVLSNVAPPGLPRGRRFHCDRGRTLTGEPAQHLPGCQGRGRRRWGGATARLGEGIQN